MGGRRPVVGPTCSTKSIDSRMPAVSSRVIGMPPITMPAEAGTQSSSDQAGQERETQMAQQRQQHGEYAEQAPHLGVASS